MIGDTTHFTTSSVIWILDDDLDVVEALQEQLLVWGAKVRAFPNPTALLGAAVHGRASAMDSDRRHAGI